MSDEKEPFPLDKEEQAKTGNYGMVCDMGKIGLVGQEVLSEPAKEEKE